jgi:monoamine oxidase
VSEPGSLTRRRLFGAAAAGGGARLDRGGLPALSRAAGRAGGPGEPPRIAIVGAGLAGLTCAYRLHQHGLPSTLYEAHEERVGGRRWTAREFAAGQTAEHGGEFIDSSHRRIRALAAELGLTLDDVRAAAGHMPRLHPRLVLGGRVRRFRDVYRDAGLLEARAAADARRIGSFQWNRAGRDARELDETTAAEWIAQTLPEPSQRLLRVATSQLMSEEYGLDPDRLSAINMLIQFGPFGPESNERFHVHGGNDRLPTASPRACPPAPCSSPTHCDRCAATGIATHSPSPTSPARRAPTSSFYVFPSPHSAESTPAASA